MIIGWIAVAAALTLLVQPLEKVTQENSGSLVSPDTPATAAMLRIGKVFQEADSTGVAMIVLEGDHKLGDADHAYYDKLVSQLVNDKSHVQSVMNLWGKPVTAAGNQSTDGKAAYVLVRIVGDTGESRANQSVDALNDIVEHAPRPPGLHVYVTGPAPLASDALRTGDKSMGKLTLATIAMITVLLIFTYRSIISALLPLVSVLVELLIARGVVSLLALHHLIEISTFASNVMVSLVLGAGTDYGMFLLGRYHEARHAGEDRETAYLSAFHSVRYVILGSGLAVAGGTFCLSFTKLAHFRTMGAPCAIALLVTIAVALTLCPALLAAGLKLGLFDPKRAVSQRRWRRIGTAVVRWPVPVLVASSVVMLVGAITLPTYVPSYSDRDAQPANTPANIGYQAADRHFPAGRLDSDQLLIEADHDLRNSADMITLDKVAKNIFRVRGIAMVQSITRPLGVPLEHTSIPYMLGYMGSKIGEGIHFLDNDIADFTKVADLLQHTVKVTGRMQELMRKLADSAKETGNIVDETTQITDDIRDDIGNFDDFMRPIRNYFYWEPHCFDIPICAAFRSVFDAMDGLDQMTDVLEKTAKVTATIGVITPEMAEELTGVSRDLSGTINLLLVTQSTLRTMSDQLAQLGGNMRDMGHSFENAKDDDFFYLPPEAFSSPDFQVDLHFYVSPDGKAARMLVYHDGQAQNAAGFARDDEVKTVARESLKGTPLADAKVSLGGATAYFKDIRDGADRDLIIAAISTLSLIFLIMLLITGSLVAALTILGTVAFSFAGAFGLSVLVWQHLLGRPLNWMVLPIAFIVLVAVGSDYNLLLVSRIKEELGAGLKTGMIRAIGSTGGVVTSAGLVFAFTMLAMVTSDLQSVGQIGSTICIGLLIDTLIVRSFIVPAIARLLGPWFWWPQRIQARPRAKARV